MNDIKISINEERESFIKNLLNSTLREVMYVVNAECGSLFLFDPQNKDLVLDSFYNSDNLYLRGLRRRVGEGIAGKVADIKTPILVKDINLDARFMRNGYNHYRTDSFISIPIFSAKGLLGLVNLADKSSREPFSEKDLNLAVSMFRYACLAVDSFNKCTQLKQEKETLDKQKLLLEKYASVGKLTAGIVHEINNPLDGIIRYTNILIDQTKDNSITREYLLEVKKGLSRIANITKSLLEFSHQVNFNQSQTKKYTDIHKLMDESLDVLCEKLNGNIQVQKKYKEDLPKILDLGLSHVLINMIKNAVDAMPGGGILEISTGIRDSVVEIIFKDTGLGVPAEIQERIFEPFFTTKSIDKGTGLGLAICNEIIHKYEGTIEVKSYPKKGSTFTVIIPQKYLENAK